MRQKYSENSFTFWKLWYNLNIHNLKRGVYKYEKVGFQAKVLAFTATVFRSLWLFKSSNAEAPKAYIMYTTRWSRNIGLSSLLVNKAKSCHFKWYWGLFTMTSMATWLQQSCWRLVSVSRWIDTLYKICKGVKWFTSDGEEYAEVTANDFVTGLKHAADKKSAYCILLKIL